MLTSIGRPLCGDQQKSNIVFHSDIQNVKRNLNLKAGLLLQMAVFVMCVYDVYNVYELKSSTDGIGRLYSNLLRPACQIRERFKQTLIYPIIPCMSDFKKAAFQHGR